MRKLIFLCLALFSTMATSDEDLSMSGSRLFLGGLDVRVDSKWIADEDVDEKLLAGNYARKIVVDGRARYYKLHVPPGYRPDYPLPLLLLFHGGGGYPDAIRYQSGMDSNSDRNDFIVAYPAGYNDRMLKDRLLMWNDGRVFDDGKPYAVDDVAFVKALLDDLQKYFNYDETRVFAAGFSNGAQFSYRLAREIPERISGIAVVAGQRSAVEGDSSCPAKPVSVIQFAGKKDPVAPFDGGSPQFKTAFRTKLKPVEETIMTWVECNGCDKTRVTETKVGSSVVKKWEKCKDNTKFVLWILGDGGHTWAGGKTFPSEVKKGVGPVSKDVNASAAMWDFLGQIKK